MLHVTTGLVLLIFSFSGCAWINQNRLADSRTEGRIENNIYTSPRQSFRFRIPWLSTNATLRDERPRPNTILVTIQDDLCREFIVSERPGFLGAQSLQSWVDANIVEDIKRLGFKVESKALMTPQRHGHRVALPSARRGSL